MSKLSAQSNSASYEELKDTKDFTVSEVVEWLGFTTHHLNTVGFVWWLWTFYGWSSTLLVYALDAAGESNSAWTLLTSPADQLTVEDRSLCLLVAGLLGVIGNPALCFFSDVYGRVTAVELAVVGTIAVMLSCALVHSRSTLMILFCLYPAGGPPLISQSLLSEWLPVEWRGIFGTSLHALWNVGRIAMTVLWVMLPPSEHWVAFFYTGAFPCLLLSAFIRFRGWRYESPRVLAVTGNVKASLSLLKLAAESDAVQNSIVSCKLEKPEDLRLDDGSGHSVEVQNKSWQDQLSELMVPEFRVILFAIGVISFSISFAGNVVYFWFIEYLKERSMDKAIVPTMLAAPAGKIFGNTLLLVGGRQHCVIDRYPRVPIMQIGLFGYAFSITGFFFCTSVTATTLIMFVSQIFEELVWTAQSIYLIEAFPTTVRNSAIGVMGAICLLGGILGSSASGLLMQAWIYLPLVAMMVLLLVGGFAGFLLPGEEDQYRHALADTKSKAAHGSSDHLPYAADIVYGSCDKP